MILRQIMIIVNIISCLYKPQCIVALLLMLMICTPITTFVSIPYEAAAQRLTRTLKNGTSDLGIATHVGDAAQSSHIGDNKTGPKQLEIMNQQLSTPPNSGAINEQTKSKTSSSEDLRTIGKTGEITLKGEPTTIGINANANLIYVGQSLDLPPYAVITVIDGKTNSVIRNIDMISGLYDIAVNPNTNMIYVTNSADDITSVIDGKTNSVVKAIATGLDPAGLAVNPNTNMIYV